MSKECIKTPINIISMDGVSALLRWLAWVIMTLWLTPGDNQTHTCTIQTTVSFQAGARLHSHQYA